MKLRKSSALSERPTNHVIILLDVLERNRHCLDETFPFPSGPPPCDYVSASQCPCLLPGSSHGLCQGCLGSDHGHLTRPGISTYDWQRTTPTAPFRPTDLVDCLSVECREHGCCVLVRKLSGEDAGSSGSVALTFPNCRGPITCGTNTPSATFPPPPLPARHRHNHHALDASLTP